MLRSLPATRSILLSLLLLSLALTTASAQEWWIGPISKGGGGTGTLADPYDGSNQTNFDKWMSGMCWYTNSVIHILPGVYKTAGYAWNLGSGQKIIGSGMAATTIKLASPPTNQPVAVIYSYRSPQVTGIEVSDLTIDCNGSPNQTVKVNGIVIWGTQIAIRRIRVINACGGTGDAACPIFICNSGENSDGNIVEQCEISSFQGSNDCRAISLVWDGTHKITGSLLNNRVFLNPACPGQMAFWSYGSHNVLLHGNYVNGAGVGFEESMCPATNIMISHNFFINCARAVDVGSCVQNCSIAFNKITVPGNGTGIRIANQNSSGVLLLGNTFAQDPNVATPPIANFNIQGVTGVTIANNTLMMLANSGDTLNNCSNPGIYVYNNVGPDGAFFTNFTQVAPPNSLKTVKFAPTSPANALYSVLPSDKFIGADTTQCAATIKLPTATGFTGKEFVIADVGGAIAFGHELTIQSQTGETINKSYTPLSITNAYGTYTVISDGAAWFAH